MFKKYPLLVILAMMLSVVSFAQTKFYYGSDGPIQLTEDPSSYVIITPTKASLEKIDGKKSYTGIKSVEAFSHKRFAVVNPTDSKTKTTEILSSLGLASDDATIAPSLVLNDGFRVYLTPKIVFKPKSPSDISAIMATLNTFSYRGVQEVRGKYRVTLNDVNDALDISNAIYETNLTQFSHPDFYAEIKHTNDPLFDEQFQMHNTGQTIDGVVGTADADVNALEAWGITLGSSDIIVAVIDDGMEAHEDLNDANGNSRIIGGFTPGVGGDGGTTAGSDHGVACAGIVGASHNGIGVQGVAPLIKFLTVNIFVAGITNEDLGDGITWAKDNGADVMSNSWGYSSCTFDVPSLSAAMADANANGRGGLGSILVFASGNDFGTCVSYPADHPDVIAVGAYSNQGIKSNYSNAGPTLDLSAPSNTVGNQPGAGVRTTDRMGAAGYTSGNYVNGFGGTSAACPAVAGVAALVLGFDNTLTSTELKDLLYSTAKDFGAAGFDNEFGHGSVDALAALQALGGGGGPTCTDGIQNGMETGIDCGGPDCPECPVDPTCDDGIQNGMEEGVDCGGPECPACPTCDDGIQNGMETGIDCGGPDCPDCPVEPTCDDGIQNGMEEGVDCGGPDCAPCDMGPCGSDFEVMLDITLDNNQDQTTWDIKDASGAVVQSGGPYNKGGGGRFGGGGSGDQSVDLDFCLAQGCYVFTIYDSAGNGLSGNGSYTVTSDGVVLASGGSFGSQEATPFCLGDGGMEPTCDDGIQNGLEEGIDCGGPDCPACPVEPTCDDGIQNGMETGIDCGGPDCPACPVEPTCDDGIQNGMETGVDCGGPDCAPCDMGCDGELISSSDFESGLGIWNDGGSDCRRSASDAAFANSGTYCVRLRDNSSSSTMTTDNLALAGSTTASISFSYIARSMDNSSEGFMVEYSTNGGATFTVAEEYRRDSDFQNNVRGSVDLEISAAFTNSTQFRIRCDASTNSDYVYIDDVDITGCNATGSFSGSNISDNSSELLNLTPGNLELLTNFSVYPNPVRDILQVNFDLNASVESMVNVRIIDLNGRVVSDQQFVQQNGSQQLSINTGTFSEGIYHLVLTSDSEMKVKKFVVMK